MPDFNPPLPSAWRGLFDGSYTSQAFADLAAFVDAEYAQEAIYPARENIFRALKLVSPAACRVVILGQDPYPTPGNAQGLSFPSHRGRKFPGRSQRFFPSCNAAFRIGNAPPAVSWNPGRSKACCCSTRFSPSKGAAPLSHAKKGWEEFTRAVIRYVQARSPFVVFLLWGANAQKSVGLIDQSRHAVLMSSHPSRLAQNSLPAPRKFVGNNHFIETNRLLMNAGLSPIKW